MAGAESDRPTWSKRPLQAGHPDLTWTGLLLLRGTWRLRIALAPISFLPSLPRLLLLHLHPLLSHSVPCSSLLLLCFYLPPSLFTFLLNFSYCLLTCLLLSPSHLFTIFSFSDCGFSCVRKQCLMKFAFLEMLCRSSSFFLL